MASARTFAYRVVSGYFCHDDEETGPGYRAKTRPDLGLINRTYETDAVFDPAGNKTQWERLVYFVEHQNRLGQGKVQYKLIILIRHGQGYHNVKEAQVGRQAWDAQWSRLEGDGNTSWSDARLTQAGREQAEALNVFWRQSIQNKTIPVPERYYTSPLARCLETTRIAYSGLPGTEFKPIVKEKLRERNGEHTCDRRNTRSWIASSYPEYDIEAGFAENDEEWKPDHRETEGEIASRVKQLLDDVFTHEEKTIISFTGHSGLTRALYSVTNHRNVWVAAGAMVPLLIRAELATDG
ncbi:phosphoglycerate mutase-like protein [Hypoxylon sp. FL1284]|nr:phosphoglycerate mutase-like protein [Hypoxylon sp. FL1284]